MVAAQIFNQRNGEPIESIYGAVTTGTDWKFLKLTDKTVFIDKRDYFINEVSQILGILTSLLRRFTRFRAEWLGDAPSNPEPLSLKLKRSRFKQDCCCFKL